jgi:NodT family efflux transporter outer membrane factor (OMF) lipoprotein
MNSIFRSILLTALLSGCAIGPDYKRPEIAAAAAPKWSEAGTPGTVTLDWWRQFNDPTLTSLLERALKDSPDMAEAQARLAEARANRDAAAGGRLPQVRASGSATKNRMSENGAIPVSRIPGFKPEYGMLDLGFDASWEIDLWGKHAREIEGAEAQIGAAEARRQDAMLMLVAEVARNYMELRDAQAELATDQATHQADADIAALTRLRFSAGETSRLDYDLAQAAEQASAANISGTQARVTAAAYRIAALIGTPPEEMKGLIERPAALPTSPDAILVGVRSELLERRPDVRRAERELAAATAAIGSAKADLFPHFSLLGSFGQQSRSGDALFDGSSTRFSVGPSFSWPIFAGGTIRAQVRAADARADAAGARYEKAVMSALADSETAINRFLNTGAALDRAQQALTSAQSAYTLSQQREQRGEDDRLTLNRAKKSLLSAQRARDQAARGKSEAAIALYKALGGGWSEDPEAVR